MCISVVFLWVLGLPDVFRHTNEVGRGNLDVRNKGKRTKLLPGRGGAHEPIDDNHERRSNEADGAEAHEDGQQDVRCSRPFALVRAAPHLLGQTICPERDQQPAHDGGGQVHGQQLVAGGQELARHSAVGAVGANGAVLSRPDEIGGQRNVNQDCEKRLYLPHQAHHALACSFAAPRHGAEWTGWPAMACVLICHTPPHDNRPVRWY